MPKPVKKFIAFWVNIKAFFRKLAAQLYIEGVDFFLFAFFDHEIHNFAVGDGARGAFSAVAAELGYRIFGDKRPDALAVCEQLKSSPQAVTELF